MQQVGWHPDVGLLFPKSVVKELWLDIWGAIFVIIFFNHNPFTKLRSNKTDRRDHASLNERVVTMPYECIAQRIKAVGNMRAWPEVCICVTREPHFVLSQAQGAIFLVF